MKRHVTIEFTEASPDKLKGEEFDAALEGELEGLELDGWEVKRVALHQDSFAKQAKAAEKEDLTLSAQMDSIVEAIAQGKADELWPTNPQHTYAAMLAWTWKLMNE